jgi:hypothetical protein
MKKDYAAIPGLGTGRAGFQVGMRSRLYCGSDHLLLVQSTGYTEDYRRVFFRDIRYVVTRENRRNIWLSCTFAGLILILCLLHFLYLSWFIIAMFCVPFAVGLLVNLARGITCNCYVRTDVQTLLLPTPQRKKKVPILIEFLKTKVPSPESKPAVP